MPTEIERRFLVTECRIVEKEKRKMPFDEIWQGYFETPPARGSFRVRIYNNAECELAVKRGKGVKRREKQLKIQIGFGEELTDLVRDHLEKTRYYKNGWEIDFLKEPLAGIVLAEYEAKKCRDLPDGLPEWIGRGTDVTEALTNHHLARLATLLGNSGVDPLAFVLDRLEKRIIRIALVGPPGSGKSSIIKILQDEMPEVKFVPEVATILIGQVGIRPGTTAVANRSFQQAVYSTQNIFEHTSAEYALDNGQVAVAFDRGRVETAIYLAGGITEHEELLKTRIKTDYKHYDVVLYLEKPPREIFEKEKRNNPHRLETDYKMIVLLDKRTFKVWEDHPNLIFIPNGENWEAKVDAVRKAIRSAINPVARH